MEWVWHDVSCTEVKIFYYYLLNYCESLWPGLHSFFSCLKMDQVPSQLVTSHKFHCFDWLDAFQFAPRSILDGAHRQHPLEIDNELRASRLIRISELVCWCQAGHCTFLPALFITFLDASKGQQQLRTVLEWQMNVLACRPSGWCANRFQWWPSNKTPSLESWCSSGLGTEMNFVREWGGDSERCLPAGRRSRIINRSNIPLHPDSPSRTHLWQERVETHLTVKDTDKDQSPHDSWHEIRGPKKQALSLAKHIIGSPSPVTDDIIMSRVERWILTTDCNAASQALTLSFFTVGSFTGFLEINHLSPES